jgi:hypothetical protein
MIELHLDQEETGVFIDLVEEWLAEIHAEISRTERSDYRELLKSKEKFLRKLLVQLETNSQEPQSA